MRAAIKIGVGGYISIIGHASIIAVTGILHDMMTTLELYVIPYLWILTVVIVGAVAVGKGVPILHAFGLYYSSWSFWIGVIVLVFAGWCMLLEYVEGGLWRVHIERYGQEPRHTAMLITLIYIWVMLAIRALQKQES